MLTKSWVFCLYTTSGTSYEQSMQTNWISVDLSKIGFITPLSFHLLVFEMHPMVSPENRIDRKRRNHIQATLKEVNKSKFCAAVLMLLFDLNFSYIQCIPFPICTFFCPDMVKWSNSGITDTYAVLGLLNQELPFRTPLFRGHFPWSQGCPLQRCSNVFCLCFSLVTSNLII